MNRGHELSPLSPLAELSDRSILILGTTGFLAKVMLALLVERFSPRKLYCLVRAQPSKSARQRFHDEVLGSEMFEPIRERFGASFEALIDQKVEVLSGDIGRPQLSLDDETAARIRPEVDLVINSAGLVNFNPPLDSALTINALGAHYVAEFVKSCTRAKLVHISTCYVAGNRSGHIREDEPFLGNFPRQKELPDTPFDWLREVQDLERAIKEVRARTEDAALEARFREEAQRRLLREGREHDARTLRAAVTNQRRRWVAEELIRIGIERAQFWGWPNIYTYTKALGEQAIASQTGLDWAIVRPAIVESANEYPFPGWNEGMNTSAPLAYLGLQGQVIYPAGQDLILDVVPVDDVASTTLAAGAALLAGERSQVYQVCASDINPTSMARVVTLVGLYKRRKARSDEARGEIPWWKARLIERTLPLPLPLPRYQRFSAPTLKRWTSSVRGVLERMEPERYGPLAGFIETARERSKEVEEDLGKVVDVFDLFLPFIWENSYVFHSNQTRSLFERMNAADRSLLPFVLDRIDWRHYWLEIHLPGLERWVFPKLRTSGPKRIAIPRADHDLAQLFESRTEEHARRVAYRLLRKDDVADSYSYRDVRRSAEAVALFLAEQGIGPKDRVLLVSEARPEWGVSYFGIILAGGTVVPVDAELAAPEILNLARASGAKGAIVSERVAVRLPLFEEQAEGDSAPFTLWRFERVFERAHEARRLLERPKRSPEDLASIIFTSGTTGRPKGVMLTDRNLSALVARTSALFRLQRSDSLLSVLPLHHTFEFSTGLLLPLASGASVTYLEERTPELLLRAFAETPVTAMVGVPAIWESFHRKIEQSLENRGRVVEFAVRGLMRTNRALRDRFGWNFGRWVFRSVHDAFGGRIRFMVSGAAALRPAIKNDLYGLGFNVYEGYGLTEASPVISVGWPGYPAPAGSVGWPLPGVEVRIDRPDENGVGEILARGPTIMAGYLDDPEATAGALQGGWLHTGDQGRTDASGFLHVVGRQKDVIVEASGKNVYPDEVEELYAGSPYVKDFAVAGVPAENGHGERVAALVVPDYDAFPTLPRDEVRERAREHFREVGAHQPFARRIKVLHVWDGELPRTATRKVKRSFVEAQLVRLERTLRSTRELPADGGVDARTQNVLRTVASIAQRPEVRLEARLVEELGFDSLMLLELLSALEVRFPKASITQDEMQEVDSVADVVRLALRDQDPRTRVENVGDREAPSAIEVPEPLRRLGKAALGMAQRAAYGQFFEVEVFGRGNVPANRNFIVAANHASHLDMGLVKFALGDFGRDLVTLAAQDYFFADPLRRAYFENFTNLLPIDRHGSLKRSMRLAIDALRRGSSLLIFPEGTRSRDGALAEFKAAIGFLSFGAAVDVLPIYVDGTHQSMPVGRALPRRGKLTVRIGEPVVFESFDGATRGLGRAEAYRALTAEVERRVRALAAERPARNLPIPLEPEVPAPEDDAGAVILPINRAERSRS